MPTFATQRQLANHAGEPLLFEVQLLRVGGVNLPRRSQPAQNQQQQPMCGCLRSGPC
ncbi:hypothetical protein CHLNCDRAFT_133710 [Chlorella variabilis]|uniref:Uncharacterized protein n=1 Tax=Chlorella variabilis TaxID=554065 RepID=E1ZF32_CHLVA|nr:hypothetical protein CHLNCDRAFT_133710 [Chlorella variabilis]EFN55428.1 hypothetical protein CHLNCDRAFT_133710 [Chlorella variabilis]|eukprot:XP_005847530.1 hypothetical protein CHLNCDRAFT_133710 [Chlorella variabilis]